MLKDITELTISGKCYSTKTKLKLFENKINIVYGRNGSGKSTISNAIRDIASGVNNGVVSANFDSSLTEEERKQIFVYDEKFVDAKIKVSHDGYDTIVMFGKQNDLQAEIDKCTKLLAEKNYIRDDLNIQLTELASEKNENSSTYWKKELVRSLKQKGNFWAERAEKIRQNKRHDPITGPLIETLINLFIQFSRSNTISEHIQLTPEHESELANISSSIQQDIKEYLKAEKHGEIRKSIEIAITPPVWDEIRATLVEIIQEPSLNDRDKIIIEKIKSSVLPDYLSASHSYFHKNKDICPFCLRSVSILEADQIRTTLSNILNKDVQSFKLKARKQIEHLKTLSSQIKSIGDLSIITPREPVEREIEEYKNCKRKIETILDRTIKKIEEKEQHPYLPVSPDITNKADTALLEYIDSINAINEAIKLHNSKCLQLKNIKEELLANNTKLAVYENYPIIKNYILKLEAENNLKEQLSTIERNIREQEDNIAQLKFQKKDVTIALEQINESLRFIFFESNRLTLENKDGQYCVKSRGKSIKPGDLSVGERNAISMAYYFASMHDNCSIDDIYKKERIIIIDDPITSFDIENRVGMLSFIHWQIEQLFKGNENSKILFLSHDIQTVVDLSKFSANLNKEKDPGIIGEIDQSVWLLQNAQLRKIPTTNNGLKFNEYRELLLSIFDFANTISTASTLPVDGIGNKMRRIAEAISTFLYSCGIEELLRKEQLLRGLDVKKKEHYRNTLFRLVFNGMSHTQDKIKGLNSAYEVFAPSEVQKIAKSFLLFLKDTHELHLFCMLDNTKMQIIKNWEQEIFPSS